MIIDIIVLIDIKLNICEYRIFCIDRDIFNYRIILDYLLIPATIIYI